MRKAIVLFSVLMFILSGCTSNEMPPLGEKGSPMDAMMGDEPMMDQSESAEQPMGQESSC